MRLIRIQSRCKERSAHIHTHQRPLSSERNTWHITLYNTASNWHLRLVSVPRYWISEVVKGSLFQSIRAISFFSSPKSLMLIKAECLISPRWPVNLNYLFVFLFTVSVCLQFFISLWRSVIGACVSFWLEWLPDDPSWWYVDDLLIYGF